jgi:hypothetical protein
MRRFPGGLAAFLLLSILASATPASAQLRPLDPLDWRIFEGDNQLMLALGAGVLWDQPLPLAGSRGTLQELGTYRVLWRSGRVGLDLSGVAFWQLREDSITGPPAPGVEPAANGVRRDPGPVVASTLVRLSPEQWPTTVLVRFGTRIPTTSDESGLERDRTDFFALAGVRWRRGAWALAGEGGVGINGARLADYPQSDALLYAGSLLHERGALGGFVAVTGQRDGLPGSILGNEDKSELRLGLRVGRRYWLQTTWVRGLTDASPGRGVLLLAGFTAGCRTDCLPFN